MAPGDPSLPGPHPAPFQDAWAQPLFNFARFAAVPQVRLAALAAALALPLGRGGLAQVVALGWPLLRGAPPGSPLRREAIALAARVPLLTAREVLRQLAANPDEPDQDAVAAALAEAGDPSRILPLLEQAAAGNDDAFRLLAIAPLEEAKLLPAHFPAPGAAAGADARLWHALALGRLGIFDALLGVFAPGAPLPELFWGSPWTAWERIAAIRPIPDTLAQALAALLTRLQDALFEQNLGPELARALRLTAWAATGRADAEGTPLPPPRPFGPIQAPPPFQTRLAVPELLTAHLTAPQPELDDGQIAWMIAATPTQALIQDVITLADRGQTPASRLHLLQILALAAHCQAGRAPGPFRGDGPTPGAPGKVELIDDRTRARIQPLPHPRPVVVTPTGRTHARGLVIPDSAKESSGPGRYDLRGIIGPPLDLELFEGLEIHLPDSAGAEPAPAPGTQENPLAADEGLEAALEEAPEETPEEEENKEERKVRAKILLDGQPRTTFLAGATHTLRCWIGLAENDQAASADQPIQQVRIPEGGLLLSAELLWNDQSGRAPLLLPAARTARSGDCDFTLQVPADERYVSADILFRYQGRIFEAVKLEAAVLAAGETPAPRDELRIRVQLARREVLALTDTQPWDATLVFGTTPPTPADPPPHPLAPTGGAATLRIFDGTGARSYTLASPETAIENLNTLLFNTEKSLVRRQAAKPDGTGGLDPADEEVRLLLRDMARFGSWLFHQLQRQGFSDLGERIQLLSLAPDEVLPLELVYDRGYPAEGARLCQGWPAALAGDAPDCPACAPAPPAGGDGSPLAQTLCPFGFWSLRKVIERLDPATAAATSSPALQRRSLPAIDSAVFASSDKVPEAERTATWTAIQTHVGRAVLARHWGEWHKAVRQHPRLLVALPHHDVEAVEDFLEIGDPRLGPDFARLGRGQITADYVNPDGQEPGPILLLLGCRTGTESELGYARLVREFQQLKTSIVLGTLAQILGRHAAPLAREVVEQLLNTQDPQTDFGTLMRRVRRRMLARGYLLALCLVALGDGAWRLTPTPKPVPGAPPPAP